MAEWATCCDTMPVFTDTVPHASGARVASVVTGASVAAIGARVLCIVVTFQSMPKVGEGVRTDPIILAGTVPSIALYFYSHRFPIYIKYLGQLCTCYYIVIKCETALYW